LQKKMNQMLEMQKMMVKVMNIEWFISYLFVCTLFVTNLAMFNYVMNFEMCYGE
jgi:hypothetical protein